MHKTMQSLVLAILLLAGAAPAWAREDAPEVQRTGPTTAQQVGQVHTLRNIPEACVRLDGQFTGNVAAPYRFDAVRHERCAQRAVYAEAARLDKPPGRADGWILNDRISVPRADAPACVATIEIWRRPGDAAPPQLDAQGRARLYLDKPQAAVGVPVFTATLHASAGCKAAGG